jgi:hypothetical protein
MYRSEFLVICVCFLPAGFEHLNSYEYNYVSSIFSLEAKRCEKVTKFGEAK